MFDPLSIHIQYVPGIGPKRAEILQKEIDLHTVGDLIRYYPYKHIDRSRLYTIREVDGTMPFIQLRGEIVRMEEMGEGRKQRLVAHFADGTDMIELVWFQSIRYIRNHYKLHTPYIVFGRPTVYGNSINIAHPEITEASKVSLSEMGLMPVYHTTDRMKRMSINSEAIRKYVLAALQSIKIDLRETLPPWLLEECHLIPLTRALRQIHFPKSAAEVREATYRLKFEELFYIQLQLLRYSKHRTQKYQGFMMPAVGGFFHEFYTHHLPFSLTEAQKRVVREIKADISSGQQMNRLLQGDVGSGKTLVALMTMLLANDNGYQTCLMAPTEILAAQHLETIRTFLNGVNIRVELLMGSIKGKQRTDILEGTASGQIHILVGTHAILEDTVTFAKLGLVIIDEQHRFGVAQRARLWAKNMQPPHVLVMTATPIPRTLAMTLYGDLEVSIIDELPPGRKPIRTEHRYAERRALLYQFLRREIEKGRQVYIVYPLIEESKKKKQDLRNLEEGYEQIKEAFPTCQVSKVHGRLKPKEKGMEMDKFVTGETQIMVATTVIEVGVNVPNASVMVIENAERFGLSQLHQLRGRVGRGAEQSYCILMTNYNISSDTRKRIDIMVKTNDGFEIAEADLMLRGPGDMEGTQQSGIAFDLRIANIARDGQLLQYVRDTARRIVEADPDDTNPRNELLRHHLVELRKEQPIWSVIS